MRKLLFFTFVSLSVVTNLSVADYAWIPGYQVLYVRFGGEYLNSSQNYLSDGSTVDLVYQRAPFANTPLTLTDFRFFIEPEYGFAKNLSFSLRGDFVIGNIEDNSGALAFGSSNIGDLKARLKWKLRPKAPILTAEVYFNIPTYKIEQVNLQTDDLLPGDGSFDIGLVLNSGYRIKDFFMAFSPGLVFRSSGYASAITLKAAVGGRYRILYGYLFTDAFLSLADQVLFDSSLDNHDALGGGGSFARLSASPKLFSGGFKLGVRLYKKYSFEFGLNKTFWGRRAPNFIQVGFNFLFVNDFYKAEERIKVKDVPFDQKDL